MMMSTLSHILRALRNDAGTGVHGTDISQKLGISRGRSMVAHRGTQEPWLWD